MAGTVIEAANPLWDWSVKAYARPSVAAACLALQDACDADVNLLLAAAYLAAEQRCWNAQILAMLTAAVAEWREQLVLPLRAARTAVKRLAPDSPLRTALREAELMAERRQQDLLWSVLSQQAMPACLGDALAHNLALLADGKLAEAPWRLLLAALRSG